MNGLQYLAYQLQTMNLLKILEMSTTHADSPYIELLSDIVSNMEEVKKEYDKYRHSDS